VRRNLRHSSRSSLHKQPCPDAMRASLSAHPIERLPQDSGPWERGPAPSRTARPPIVRQLHTSSIQSAHILSTSRVPASLIRHLPGRQRLGIVGLVVEAHGELP
jgi:hypothetical protein